MELSSLELSLIAVIVVLVLILLWLLRRSALETGERSRYRGPTPAPLERRAFLPGRMVLQIQHGEAALERERIEGWLRSIAPRARLEGDPITLRAGEAGYRSLLSVEVDDNDQQLLQRLLELNRPGEKREGDGLRLLSAGPDWLASCSQQGGSPTGGPGGWPTPVTDFTTPNLSQVLQGAQWRIRRPAAAQSWGAGRGVNVAILDTLPDVHHLAQVYAREHERASRGNAHPLALRLLQPNGRVKFYPASYEALERLAASRTACHEYKMADHGLFIAGLIHEIAPEANLHLIEVMNEYGVGDSFSLGQGIQKLQELIERSSGPWVVNCSFMVDAPDPRGADARPYYPPTGSLKTWLEKLEQEELVQQLERMLASTRELYALLDTTQERRRVCLVAAAGNDSGQAPTEDCTRMPTTDRYRARFPAAFDEFIGVAALTRGAAPRPAGYSNYADNPANSAFAALGGEAGPGQGVLGIYLGDFPVQRNPDGSFDYQVNTGGWAWWAGTSFAAPMVSGLAAAILSTPAQPNDPRSARERVAQYLQTLAQTQGDDRMLPLTQP